MKVILTFILLFSCLTACQDEICGPATIETPAINAVYRNSQDQELTFAYGEFNASPNNDCTPNVGDPTSITVDGRQQDDRSFHFAFCLPRPHQIGSSSILLSNTDLFTELYVNGSSGDCTIRIDRSQAMTGAITFRGLCDNGTHASGFSMVFDGEVGGIEKCEMDGNRTEKEIRISLSGEISVEKL